MKSRFAILIWLLVISACSTPQSTSVQDEPTPFAYPQDESAITTPTVAQTEQEISNACIDTIQAYIAIDRCTNWNEYHELFSTQGPHYKVTPKPDGGTYCNTVESAEVVKILPVEEWWNSWSPETEISPSAKPTLPGERVYYVEIYITMKPEGGPPPDPNPFSQLMWMLPENGKCLIRDYGW
ncbi:MAG: hypothetical protein ACOY0R_02385 [Chloroflexota bacterium]